MAATDTIDEIRINFIEKMGLLSQDNAMPRGAGRVFALLVYDGMPISSAEIARSLQLSRASVSNAVRLLEERELVRRTTRPGDRQDYFETSADAFVAMLKGARRRLRHIRDEIESTAEALPDTEPGPKDRLHAYAGIYEAMADGLLSAIERIDAQTRKEEGAT